MYTIDSQVHVWEADNPAHPWLASAIQAMHADPMTIERVISAMDAVAVDAAVLVCARICGYDNGYALESACKYPDRVAVVGRVDVDVPDPDAVMKGWRAQPGMLGFRLLMMRDSDMAELDRATPLLKAAERHGVPMSVYAERELDRLPALARAFPDLQIVIDHLGIRHKASPDEFRRTLPIILGMAAFPNVAIKVSAAPLHSTEAYPFADLWPSVHAVINAFGAERCMWGSDITSRVGRHHTYSDAVGWLRETNELSAADKAMLLDGALRRVLRWQPSGRHAAFRRSPADQS